jgi:hypothetical protein
MGCLPNEGISRIVAGLGGSLFLCVRARPADAKVGRIPTLA